MILFFAACQSPSIELGPTPTVEVTRPITELVFEQQPDIALGTDRVLGTADLDGDHRDELFGVTERHEVVVWSDGDTLVLTEPLDELLGADQAWVVGASAATLDDHGSDVLVSIRSEAKNVWTSTVLRVGLDGTLEVLVEGDVAEVSPIADLDGDGRSELIVRSDEGAWLDRSAGVPISLSEEIRTAWEITPLLVEEGALLLHNGGYGIHQAWLLSDDGELLERIEGIYGYELLTDGRHDRPASEVVLSVSDTASRFDGAGFGELDIADRLMVAGKFDDHLGADVIGLDGDTPVAFSNWTELPMSGLPAETYDWMATDLDGDGLDDVVRPTWNDEGGVLEVFLNRSR
ncbi:MAG: hypothetical protein GY913_26435 [Proteobacteria bacterium]|nr:hypothetical protein [Pseudomonadota bacterium]